MQDGSYITGSLYMVGMQQGWVVVGGGGGGGTSVTGSAYPLPVRAEEYRENSLLIKKMSNTFQMK